MIRTLWPVLIGLCLSGSLALAADDTTLVMQGLAPESNGGYTLRQVHLNYNRDALTKADAQMALHQRIQAAAVAVCHCTGGLQTARIEKKVATCQKKAIREALAEVDLPALAKADTQKTADTDSDRNSSP